MDVKQSKVIATASVQFNQYLLETHGADENKTAKRDMIRSEIDPAKMNLEHFSSSDDLSETSFATSNEDSDEELDESDMVGFEMMKEKARRKSKASRRVPSRGQKTRKRRSSLER